MSFSDATENVPPQYRQLGAAAEFANGVEQMPGGTLH